MYLYNISDNTMRPGISHLFLKRAFISYYYLKQKNTLLSKDVYYVKKTFKLSCPNNMKYYIYQHNN